MVNRDRHEITMEILKLATSGKKKRDHQGCWLIIFAVKAILGCVAAKRAT
jgi:hypothetical protein